jgi:hydrogenase expression/formation protein HypD
LGLRPRFKSFDALERFALAHQAVSESPLCIAGQVLRGNATPHDCPAFGRECTPASPLGAPMVHKGLARSYTVTRVKAY